MHLEEAAASVAQVEVQAPGMAQAQALSHAIALQRGDYLAALDALHKYSDHSAGVLLPSLPGGNRTRS